MHDKVIPNVGLGIHVKDILEIKPGKVHRSDADYFLGQAFFDVIFELIVFAPKKGQSIIGRVQESTAKGVAISLGFFENIIVPEHELGEGCTFDAAAAIW